MFSKQIVLKRRYTKKKNLEDTFFISLRHPAMLYLLIIFVQTQAKHKNNNIFAILYGDKNNFFFELQN